MIWDWYYYDGIFFRMDIVRSIRGADMISILGKGQDVNEKRESKISSKPIRVEQEYMNKLSETLNEHICLRKVTNQISKANKSLSKF